MRFLNELLESFRIAGEQIWNNRMRSFLTALGVIIGIVAVTLMGTAIEGIDTGFDESLEMIGTDVLYVQKWPWRDVGDDWPDYINRPELKSRYAAELNRIFRQTPDSQLATAVATVVRNVSVEWRGLSVRGVQANGTGVDYARVHSMEIERGRFFTAAEDLSGQAVCVLGYDVADILFPALEPVGKVVKIRGSKYRVIGVLARQGSFLGVFSFDNQVVLPLKAMRKFYAYDWGTQITAKLRPGAEREAAQDELVGAMRRVRGLLAEEKNDFEVNQTDAFEETLGPVKAGIATAGLFITGLSLFVGAIGIMNITFVSVKERTREIGTRRALGARRRTILAQFLIEAVAICLVGGLAGMALTFGATSAVQHAYPEFPFSFSFQLVLLGLAVSTGTGVFSGFAPAFTASRLDPALALRHE